MEDLVAFIAALFEALKKKRANAGTPSASEAGRTSGAPSLGRALRDAFAERVPGLSDASTRARVSAGAAPPPVVLGTSPPRVGLGTSPSPVVPGTSRAILSPSPAPGRPARPGLATAPVAATGSTLGSANVVGPVQEAGLVRTLFGTPQSLVAAFIVAEVLAKPVALREP